MRAARLRGLAFVLAAVFAAGIGLSAQAPPGTRTDSVVDRLHGVEIPDPYRWLEDQSAPEVRAWIDAQDGSMLTYGVRQGGEDEVVVSALLRRWPKGRHRGDTPGLMGDNYIVPHLKIKLLGNCCLIQNLTIEGNAGRKNQHHPVFFL